MNIFQRFLLFSLVWVLAYASGCTYLKSKVKRDNEAQNRNEALIAEESKALTTGVVDALSIAPTNPPTALALEFAKKDQQLEGIPQERIDVLALLAHDKQATKALQDRYAMEDKLLKDRQIISDKLKETQDKLVAMGELYEQEHNKTIWRRIWTSLFSTLGIAGIIALCIFCPAAIPIIGRIVGWLVNKIPSLATAFGVVAKKSFDGVVTAIEKVRDAQKEGKSISLDETLSKTLDEGPKKLIRHRKAALAI
jgi:hypothetical protein